MQEPLSELEMYEKLISTNTDKLTEGEIMLKYAFRQKLSLKVDVNKQIAMYQAMIQAQKDLISWLKEQKEKL
jgi:hypothetical protein